MGLESDAPGASNDQSVKDNTTAIVPETTQTELDHDGEQVHGNRKRTARACDRCSIARTKCDGKQPCYRCLSMLTPNLLYQCSILSRTNRDFRS